MVGLDSGCPFIMATDEGESDWNELYRAPDDKRYRHCNVEVADNKIFIYLMDFGSWASQTIRMLTFLISPVNGVDYSSM